MGLISFLLAVLAGVTIAPDSTADYDREAQYGSWIDADGDCLDTRAEVLIQESYAPVTLDGCRVVSGLWFDPYTGQTFTHAAALDIDHLVPLAEAHRSGAHAWTDERRRAYANDLENPGHLIAVSRRANRKKSDSDPAEWLPENPDFRCAYLAAWLVVKRKWGLTMDPIEAQMIDQEMIGCAQ